MGVAGVVVITGATFSNSTDWRGIISALVGTLAFSIATVAFRTKAKAYSIPEMNFWQSLVGAVGLGPFALASAHSVLNWHIVSATAIVYLAIVVTIGGMGLWFFLIRVTGAGIASTYHLLNPVFGLILSAIVLGTPLAAKDFAGVAMIAGGLYLSRQFSSNLPKAKACSQ
ncbi:MAG: DMT family transporter [Betaproteobacteria bacterium]|nr:DMT family transporter [Betaproteobacteria bacterium]